MSKIETQPELDLTFGQGRSKAQRLAGWQTGRPVRVKRRSESSADNIVYAGIVRPVRDVESFSREPQTALFANVENSAQAHVERCVIGTQAAIPRNPGRTIIREMIVAVDVRASQKVKWMTAVVADNRRQLKS